MRPTAEHTRSGATLTRRAWHRSLPLVLAVSIALWGATAAGAQERTPAAEASAYVRPAVVYIETHWSAYVQDDYGDWLNGGDPYVWTSRCSGFVVNPSGYIVTAGHCVDDSLEGARGTAIAYGIDEYIQYGWADPSEWSTLAQIAYANWTVEGQGAGTPPDRLVYVQHGEAAAGLTTGRAWPARVVEVREASKGDVALLKVEETGLPSVLVADDSDVSIGTEVLAVGYPASSDEVTDATYEPTYKDGTVSSKKTREDGLLPVYEISAAVSGGMSGGPTVDLDGQVIGVNSFKISGEEQQFNFLSPSSLVTEMLARNGVANELGRVDELYRDGLTSFFAGDYPAAMASFEQVLDRAPSHQQAQEYRTEAARLADGRGDPGDAATTAAAERAGTLPIPLPIAIAAVLLLAAGGGGFWLVKRRQPGDRGPVAAPWTTTSTPTSHADRQTTDLDTVLVDAVRSDRDGDPRTDGAPPRTAFCTNCGSPMSVDARFCGSCGQPVSEEPSLHPTSRGSATERGG